MIKAALAIVCAFYVACIVAIPWASRRGEHRAAASLMAVVAVEVVVLAVNGWRCPMRPSLRPLALVADVCVGVRPT